MNLLHVGLHKTGTTSIQTWLRDHPLELAAAGWHFPNGWLHLNNHFELPLTQLRLERMSFSRHRGDDWRRIAWRTYLRRRVRSYLELRRVDYWDVILSCEEFSLYRYPDEMTALQQIVGDARIVLYLRDRDDWRESQTAELLKPKAVTGPIGLSSDPEQFNYLEPDSWQLNYPTRVAQWREAFSDVTVLNYDQAVAEDGSVIPQFLRAVGFTPPDDAFGGYWLNPRDAMNDGRVPGTRYCGREFGDELVPTTSWQRELLRQLGALDRVDRARVVEGFKQ